MRMAPGALVGNGEGSDSCLDIGCTLARLYIRAHTAETAEPNDKETL